MPELPEVEVVRSSLEPLLVGRKITGVQLRCASLRRPVDPDTLAGEVFIAAVFLGLCAVDFSVAVIVGLFGGQVGAQHHYADDGKEDAEPAADQKAQFEQIIQAFLANHYPEHINPSYSIKS